ncbi:MAG: NRDE family protein [Acidocella sp.]|nr:NRDE family protein [Acidocella sp.]
MCSIILRVGEEGVWVAANRDEMVDRGWDRPATYWPGVTGGRDRLGQGSWMVVNEAGVMAAVLNREGSLGPAAGKRSRGELPVMAAGYASAAAAAAALAGLEAGVYRPFNLVVADAFGAFLLVGSGGDAVAVTALAPGVTMLTSGAPNDASQPRIARHLPKFADAGFDQWEALLGDKSGDRESALNIPERDGFGTVCAATLKLPRGGRPVWRFAAGPPDVAGFAPVVI